MLKITFMIRSERNSAFGEWKYFNYQILTYPFSHLLQQVP